MARTASGSEVLEQAQQALREAKTVEELRQAQAVVRDELREKYFHNRFFDSLEAVEDQLEDALHNLEHDPQRVRSITGWPWTITSLPN